MISEKSWIWLSTNWNVTCFGIRRFGLGCNDCFPSASQPTRAAYQNGILHMYFCVCRGFWHTILSATEFTLNLQVFIQKGKNVPININMRLGFAPLSRSHGCPTQRTPSTFSQFKKFHWIISTMWYYDKIKAKCFNINFRYNSWQTENYSYLGEQQWLNDRTMGVGNWIEC